MSPQASKLSALTRIFSTSVFRELARKGRSPLFLRLLNQAGMLERCDDEARVSDAFDAAFAELKIAGQRDEYVYRTALIKKILMGKHSLHTASMLHEFRVGDCKADLVILNGTATVYEIKSERDSLARLINQLQNYRRVFAAVNVIVGDNHVASVRDVIPPSVGIMRLSRRYQISVEREAKDSTADICPIAVFESLRTKEAVTVLQALGIAVPDVPNTRRYAALRDLFKELDPIALHTQMVRTLKATRNLAPLSDLVDQLPTSLHTSALTVSIARIERRRLLEAIRTPMRHAMNWT